MSKDKEQSRPLIEVRVDLTLRDKESEIHLSFTSAEEAHVSISALAHMINHHKSLRGVIREMVGMAEDEKRILEKP